MKRYLWIELFLVGSATFSWAAPASTQKKLNLNLDQSAGTVQFRAIGRPSGLKIVGKGAAPKGHMTWNSETGEVSGEVTETLDSFDTGISMRNEHMKKKYLETGRFPEAKIRVTRLSLPKDKIASDFSLDDVPFEGVMSLHGVEKPISGKAKLIRKGTQGVLDVSFETKVSDYSIAVPSFAGITMADRVEVEVHAEAPFESGNGK